MVTRPLLGIRETNNREVQASVALSEGQIGCCSSGQELLGVCLQLDRILDRAGNHPKNLCLTHSHVSSFSLDLEPSLHSYPLTHHSCHLPSLFAIISHHLPTNYCHEPSPTIHYQPPFHTIYHPSSSTIHHYPPPSTTIHLPSSTIPTVHYCLSTPSPIIYYHPLPSATIYHHQPTN